MGALADSFPDRQHEAFLAQPNVLDEAEIIHLEEVFQRRFYAIQEVKVAEAFDIIAEKRRLRDEGTNAEKRAMGMENDPFGYQKRTAELEAMGVTSGPQHEQALQGVEIQIDSGLGEFMNAITFDDPEARVLDVTEEGRLVNFGWDVGDMLDNGLTPANLPIELRRRAYERGTLHSLMDMREIEGITDVACIEVSLCTDEEHTPGYVREIQKMQIRHSRYVDTDDGRKLIVDTFYIDGRIYDLEFMNNFFKALGHFDDDEPMQDRVDILGRPVFMDAELVKDALGFIQLMDMYREDMTGEEMRLGRPKGEEINEYDEIEAINREREAKRKDAVQYLTRYSIDLMRDGVDDLDAIPRLQGQQKLMAMKICETQPELALIAFDKKTYDGILEVQSLEAQSQQLADQGMIHEAEEHMQQAEARREQVFDEAPNERGCGEFCGITEATQEEVANAEEAGLHGEKLTHKEGVCRKCGSPAGKGITYSVDPLTGKATGAVCNDKSCKAVWDPNKGATEGKKDSKDSNVTELDKHLRKKAWWKSYKEVTEEYEAQQARQAA